MEDIRLRRCTRLKKWPTENLSLGTSLAVASILATVTVLLSAKASPTCSKFTHFVIVLSPPTQLWQEIWHQASCHLNRAQAIYLILKQCSLMHEDMLQ